MNFFSTVTSVAAAVAIIAPMVGAQSPALDARISLRVEGRQLEEVVEFLRERSGANIVILTEDDGAQTPISLELTDVPWREVLELAAESAGCVVEERTGGVLAITKPPRVSFTFKDASLNDVIDTIGSVSGANIVTAPEVDGTISLRLDKVPWRDALEVAAKTLGYAVVEDRRGILRVVDPATLQDQLETRHYQLRYLRPRSSYVPVINSEFVAGVSPIPTGNLDEDFPIIVALRQALTQGGDLNFVPDSNTLIVRDTAQVQENIEEIVSRLDIEPAQVFVDVKFVSTTNTDLWDLGVDYGDFGPRVSVTGSQIPIALPFDLGNGGFEDSIIANDSGFGPFGDSTLNQGNTLTADTIFGALSFTGITATLRMLQRDTRTQVLQMPKIVALDGREATIFVGETIRYAEARTEQGQAGGLNLSVSEAAGSPVEVGFQLLVRPHVVPGTNTVVMEVIPKETSLSGSGDSALAPSGFDVFTVGASGASGSIALPRVRSSTIVTQLKLQSGETAMIGGLATDIDTEIDSRVPYLSAIPILGELFKHRERTRERRSLLVFVTPTIVRSGRDADRLMRAELERRREYYDTELETLLFGEEGLQSGSNSLEQPIGPESEVDLTTFVDPGDTGK